MKSYRLHPFNLLICLPFNLLEKKSSCH